MISLFFILFSIFFQYFHYFSLLMKITPPSLQITSKSQTLPSLPAALLLPNPTPPGPCGLPCNCNRAYSTLSVIPPYRTQNPPNHAQSFSNRLHIPLESHQVASRSVKSPADYSQFNLDPSEPSKPQSLQASKPPRAWAGSAKRKQFRTLRFGWWIPDADGNANPNGYTWGTN